MKKTLKLAVMASTLISSVAFSQCADISAPGVWDVVKTGSNPVVATTANPLSGTCSMEVPINSGKRYVQDDMTQETSFRGSFQIDPNGVVLPASGSRKIKVHLSQCGAGCSAFNSTDWFQAKLRRNNGTTYKLGMWARDAAGQRISFSANLVDGCNTVEYQLIAGNPGTFRIWVNNTVEGSPDFEDIAADFTGRFADRARLGRMGQGSDIDFNAAGSYYLDTFESRRQTFIGNSCAP